MLRSQVANFTDQKALAEGQSEIGHLLYYGEAIVLTITSATMVITNRNLFYYG